MSHETSRTTSILETVNLVLPSILALVRGSRQPTDPPVTNAEILEGLQSAVAQGLQKAAAWKAANPPGVTPDTP